MKKILLLLGFPLIFYTQEIQNWDSLEVVALSDVLAQPFTLKNTLKLEHRGGKNGTPLYKIINRYTQDVATIPIPKELQNKKLVAIEFFFNNGFFISKKCRMEFYLKPLIVLDSLEKPHKLIETNYDYIHVPEGFKGKLLVRTDLDSIVPNASFIYIGFKFLEGEEKELGCGNSIRLYSSDFPLYNLNHNRWVKNRGYLNEKRTFKLNLYFK